MIHIEKVQRRDFLKGMLGAGALVLSVRVMPEELFAESGAANALARAARGRRLHRQPARASRLAWHR